MVTKIDSGTFSSCTSLRDVVIPSSVKTYWWVAFNECYGLEKIFISESVEKICKRAFRCCSSLEIVHLPATLSSIETDSFVGCDNLKAIYVPENKVDFYMSCLPVELHWLIVEDRADLPVKPSEK